MPRHVKAALAIAFNCYKSLSIIIMIKRLSRWNSLHQEVETFTLDTDNSEETSQDCAIGVEFSMRRLQAGENDEDFLKKLLLFRSTTDSGGGGTGHSLKCELLQKENLTCNEPEFLVGFCAMHILQITLSNPMKALGADGRRRVGEKKFLTAMPYSLRL